MYNHPHSVINFLPKNAIREIHKLDFGDIFFLENTIVTELHEGIIYGWEKAKEIIQLAENFFGKDFYVNYIANRIYDYSVIAPDLLKFFESKRRLRSFCIVSQSTKSIALEQLFYKEGRIMHFTDLKLALDFTGDLPH